MGAEKGQEVVRAMVGGPLEWVSFMETYLRKELLAPRAVLPLRSANVRAEF